MSRTMSCACDNISPLPVSTNDVDPLTLERTFSEPIDSTQLSFGRTMSCAVEPASQLSKKRTRSEAAENISNELADGELSTTEEEEETTKPRLSPRVLFPEPLEEGELPQDHPKAIYDTSDLIGPHASCTFTNEEADNNASQIY
uniref:Uncharacterized protein n=1 Tax=Cryptomonas curvata TaxID=233186 RepID=A0A7S0MCD4_9CRYP|mmetsp:Transcript_34685/g.72751  ORF Transcript_34685/g.72751 Transcript_34685/m.72751 type:complete len:144 (+) Transcript_34685:53-484(+)